MCTPVFISAHSHTQGYPWKHPQALVCLFSFAYCFVVLTFGHLHIWQVGFLGSRFWVKVNVQDVIRKDSGRGERKEAGLGRGRSWSSMDSQKRLQATPLKILKLWWPLRVVPGWKEGPDPHDPNWPGTGRWLALKEAYLESGHLFQLRQSLQRVDG